MSILLHLTTISYLTISLVGSYLVDLESNPCSRDNDFLDTVHIAEHPLVVHCIRAGITKKHAVEAIHEVIIAEMTINRQSFVHVYIGKLLFDIIMEEGEESTGALLKH